MCLRNARPVETTPIREFVIENHTSNRVFYLSRMCPLGSRNLYEYRRGHVQWILRISSDFNSGFLRIRRTNADCSFRICEIERGRTHAYNEATNIEEPD